MVADRILDYFFLPKRSERRDLSREALFGWMILCFAALSSDENTCPMDLDEGDFLNDFTARLSEFKTADVWTVRILS
jgi:hypothetical protein